MFFVSVWSFHGCPILIFPFDQSTWYDFTTNILWWYSHNLAMYKWFSHHFLMTFPFTNDFPMNFPWSSHDFPTMPRRSRGSASHGPNTAPDGLAWWRLRSIWRSNGPRSQGKREIWNLSMAIMVRWFELHTHRKIHRKTHQLLWSPSVVFQKLTFSWLVVEPSLWKMKVSWDDEIPKIWNVPNHQGEIS